MTKRGKDIIMVVDLWYKLEDDSSTSNRRWEESEMRVKIVAIDIRLREAMEELSKKRGESFSQTLAYVAEAAGVSQEYIYKIMAGKRHPSQRVLFALAYILKTPIEDLFRPRIETGG